MPTPAASASVGEVKWTGRPSRSDLAAVGRVDAGEDLPERALAGAVLAAERVTRAGGDLERHVLERHHAGKPLGDVIETDRGPSVVTAASGIPAARR